MKPIEDLKGKKFGSIEVLKLSEDRDNRGKILWECRCVCGNLIKVRTYNLKNGTNSCGCLNRFPREQKMALNQKFASYKRDAITKGVKFQLTKEEFEKIVTERCYYCGDYPNNWSPYLDKNGEIHERFKGKINENYMKSTVMKIHGIDRVDSLKGYNIQNTVPCCKQCNIMKNVYTEEQFINQIEKIYKFRLNM